MFQCAAARLTTKRRLHGIRFCPRAESTDSLNRARQFRATRVSLCLWQQDPTGDTGNNQYARCDCEQCALFAEFMGFSEFRKVAIAGAARTEMIEPLFSLVEWHRSRRDSLQNVRAGTPATFGIWKLPDQTTAKCVQESLFVSRGISSCVQTSLLLQGHNIK